MRSLGVDDIAATALLYRAAYDDRLPCLSGRHTAAEDLEFFKSHVFHLWTLWGQFSGVDLVGYIATCPGWIEQLYVHPQYQGKGIGGSLLEFAKSIQAELHLWTFKRNSGARQFYEGHGFDAVRITDGAENEEREPDVLYHWVRVI